MLRKEYLLSQLWGIDVSLLRSAHVHPMVARFAVPSSRVRSWSSLLESGDVLPPERIREIE
jgi:hypothetical protein